MVCSRHIERLLEYAVALLMLAMFAFQAFALRGLFADGAFQLLNLLTVENARLVNGGPDLFHEIVFTGNNEPMRFLAMLLTEFPTILALRLGVTDLNSLNYIFSSWLLLMPLLFWGLALGKVRNDFLFWAFLMMFMIAYFDGGFFAIGEYNVAYALTACCAAFILKAESNTRIGKSILAFAALASVMSYSSTMLTAPLLCLLSIRRFLHARKASDKAYWIVLALMFVASTGAGLWGYIYTSLPESLQNARATYPLLHNGQFLFILAFSALAGLYILFGKREWATAYCYAMSGLCVLFLVIPLDAAPFSGFQVRAFAGFALFLALLVTSLLSLYGRKYIPRLNEPAPAFSILPIFTLFLILSVLDIESSLEYRTYIDDFRNEVNSNTGLLPYETSVMEIKNNALYGWTWTFPTLGLLLRDNDKAAVIMDPGFQKGRWRPFDPASPPDLSRYYRKSS